MSSSSKEELNIQEALKHYTALKLQNSNVKVSKIAREFNVDYQRLLRRTHGIGSQNTRKAHNYRLDDAQQKVLIDYINSLDEIGALPEPSTITEAANRILSFSYSGTSNTPPTVSKNWALRFMKRKPEFFKKKRQFKDYQRGQAEDPSVIAHFYDIWATTIDSHGIQPSDIYNMDETGFRIGQGRRVETVYTRYPEAVPSIDSGSQRLLVTSIECISLDGEVLPPVLIIPGEVQLEEWYTKTSLPENYIIQRSKTGYTSREITYLWMHHFELATRVRQQGAWRLLIFDRHKSHISFELVQFARSNKILLLPLPSHLTHLLQPLDSIPFQQLKKNHAAAVNRLSYKSGQNYDKVHFLSDIAFIRDSTFTIAVIQAGWRETGLFPLNQDLVLNRIGALEALDCIEPTVMLDRDQVINDTANVPDYVADSMENRTPAHASDPPPSTPRTVRSTRRIVDRIKESHIELSPTIERFLRGAVYQSENYALTKARLEDELHEHAKPRYSTRSKKQVKMTDLLYVKDVPERLDAAEADKIECMYQKNGKKWQGMMKVPSEQSKWIVKNTRHMEAEELENLPDEELFLRD